MSSFRPPALLCFNSAQIQFPIASSIVFQFSSQPLTVSLSFSHCSLYCSCSPTIIIFIIFSYIFSSSAQQCIEDAVHSLSVTASITLYPHVQRHLSLHVHSHLSLHSHLSQLQCPSHQSPFLFY